MSYSSAVDNCICDFNRKRNTAKVVPSIAAKLLGGIAEFVGADALNLFVACKGIHGVFRASSRVRAAIFKSFAHDATAHAKDPMVGIAIEAMLVGVHTSSVFTVALRSIVRATRSPSDKASEYIGAVAQMLSRHP